MALYNKEQLCPNPSVPSPPIALLSPPKRVSIPANERYIARLEHEVAAIQDSASFRRYLDVQARFHAYSYNNVLLIMSQRPDAARVTSYQTWRTLERQVVRGGPASRSFTPC